MIRMYWICVGGFQQIRHFCDCCCRAIWYNLRAGCDHGAQYGAGALPLILALFKWLREPYGYIRGGWITGIIVMTITLIGVAMVEETFGKDLNYVEK
jgi:hypothetical protein